MGAGQAYSQWAFVFSGVRRGGQARPPLGDRISFHIQPYPPSPRSVLTPAPDSCVLPSPGLPRAPGLPPPTAVCQASPPENMSLATGPPGDPLDQGSAPSAHWGPVYWWESTHNPPSSGPLHFPGSWAQGRREIICPSSLQSTAGGTKVTAPASEMCGRHRFCFSTAENNTLTCS